MTQLLNNTTAYAQLPPFIERLNSGESLLFGRSMKSNDGRFTLSVRSNGLTLNGPFGSRWTQNFQSLAPLQAIMQGDGNFVVYENGSPLWNTQTWNNPGAYLALQNNGNLVLYNSANIALWNANTGDIPSDGTLVKGSQPSVYVIESGQRRLIPDQETLNQNYGGIEVRNLSDGDLNLIPIGSPIPTFIAPDRLNPGESLTASKPIIRSADGRFTLSLYEGNLNVGGPSGYTWSFHAGTAPQIVTQAIMQTDGNFVLYGNGAPLWETQTWNNPGAYLVMQNDGNLVIYGPANNPLWSTFTGLIATVPDVPPIIPTETSPPLTTNDINFEFKLWGAVLTLSHEKTQELLTTTADAMSVVNAILGGVGAVGIAINPAVTAAVGIIGTYINVERQIIKIVDKGNGIYLTYLYPNLLWAPYVPVIIPTTRP